MRKQRYIYLNCIKVFFISSLNRMDDHCHVLTLMYTCKFVKTKYSICINSPRVNQILNY